MKMTQEEYEDHSTDNDGFCTECDKITTSSIEPDAMNENCPECDRNHVYGVENALVYGYIEITDDHEEMPGDSEMGGIISFSDDGED